MSDHPILFSAPMVRAILAGTKTQTRRVMRPQPTELTADELGRKRPAVPVRVCGKTVTGLKPCPYGVPGDRLYVKEATWIWCKKTRNGLTPTGRNKYRYEPVGQHVVYCADDDKPTDPIDTDPTHCWRYKPARFMPRWAVRTWIDVVSVRAERVQEIAEDDAMAEGVAPWAPKSSLLASLGRPGGSYRNGLHELWDSINADRGYPWADNPWVWVLEFRRVKP